MTNLELFDIIDEAQRTLVENWGGMLLTGVRDLYPEIWEAIPEDMGVFAFASICNLLILLGVRTWE